MKVIVAFVMYYWLRNNETLKLLILSIIDKKLSECNQTNSKILSSTLTKGQETTLIINFKHKISVK